MIPIWQLAPRENAAKEIEEVLLDSNRNQLEVSLPGLQLGYTRTQEVAMTASRFHLSPSFRSIATLLLTVVLLPASMTQTSGA
jgi:hypothetical protein